MTGNTTGTAWNTIERMDWIAGISLLSPTVLAVQVNSRIAEEANKGIVDISRRVYVIDPRGIEGIGAFRGHGVLGGGRGLAVVYREDPFPQFALVTQSPMQ
jgi:hypothetical protein